MIDVPECFYRISVKALILNEERDRFLVIKENEEWELPGGGLDWGESVESELKREIMEEMGLGVEWISKIPAYFTVSEMRKHPGRWAANILYETKLESLNFTPTSECSAVAFVNKEQANGMSLFPNVESLLEQFDPRNHDLV